ncbi:ribosomal protein L36-domain-containing protein [Yarrowia lipolytica]|uniref:Ribosomal protein n=1 Tax=Yarrowia lipolytica TaxID=4952 RepID=A0A1D8NKH7_YARLL|nr:hypothetical protein YALI1_E34870g [Yarrowia lipolytica]KAJ8057530.1 ribosomal protein L36-domain-containing protein [Yarrowia lipolytica]QNP99275.1 Hypothetical protein YALI2_E00591g [Yarrowia lipolytica]SEI33275.1 YALIA101S03e14444g1_1 [Yarrowia lipolytica]VBB77676.1 Conserved hypothetical protein [Yarrowia lipolytica]
MFNVLRSISRVPAMITLQRPSLFQTAGQVSRPAVNAAAAITVRGMKTKSAVRKRCPDCYIVTRKGRVFNYCKTHPRHKQRQG